MYLRCIILILKLIGMVQKVQNILLLQYKGSSISGIPITVIENVHIPSFPNESFSKHVTVVTPNEYVPPDVTSSLFSSLHVMTLMELPTLSMAVGCSDQTTTALVFPAHVLTFVGHVTTGSPASTVNTYEKEKSRKANNKHRNNFMVQFWKLTLSCVMGKTRMLGNSKSC